MNDIQIREYRPSDLESIRQIFLLNSPDYFSPDEEKDLIYYLGNKIELYYVINYNGVIAGSGGINFENLGTTAIISWDMIHPDHKGKRLGAALLQQRLKVIRALPRIRRIIVRTSQLSWPFYERNGFRLLYSEKDYWAPGFDLYHMEFPA
jgi:[ribosomal protein S18]-alanine N-acetyltransferase